MGHVAARAELADDDRVVLYTDGIIEAMRTDDEMFGIERLSAIVAGAGDGTGSVVSDAIEAVTRFAGRGNTPLDDDCTIVALQVERSRTGQLR